MKKAQKQSRKVRPVKRERGILLTVLLAWVIIGNLFIIPLAILSMAYSLPFLPSGSVMALLFALAVVEIISAVGILLWKRWGVYAFAAARVVTLALNVFVMRSYDQASREALLPGLVLGIAVTLIILKLVFDRWQYFGGGSDD